MKYIVLIIGMLLFTACSPKYKIVKEYHPPKTTATTPQTSICLGTCQTKRQACKSSCKSAFNTCKIKADQIAKERYTKQMQYYTQALERYVNDVNIQMQFSAFDYYSDSFYLPYARGPFYGHANSLFWYDPMPIYSYGPRPQRPSLKQEIRKAQAEFCDLDCGCTQQFDDCYIGCGGEVTSKKVCIENCSE